MMARRLVLSLVLLTLVGNASVFAGPNASGSNGSGKTQAFDLVSLKHETVGSLTRIVIETSAPPLYTVFRPTDRLIVVDLPGAAGQVDFVNLLTFDYNGPFNNHTGFVSPLVQTLFDPSTQFNVTFTVESYLNAGVPANKILMGIPFYSYGWAITGTSAKLIAWINKSPIPGHWNTCSVMIENAMIAPSCSPVMVITGTSVFLSAWPK